MYFSDVSIAPDNSGLIYAVGSDKTMKQMQKDNMLKEVDLHTITLSSGNWELKKYCKVGEIYTCIFRGG